MSVFLAYNIAFICDSCLWWSRNKQLKEWAALALQRQHLCFVQIPMNDHKFLSHFPRIRTRDLCWVATDRQTTDRITPFLQTPWRRPYIRLLDTKLASRVSIALLFIEAKALMRRTDSYLVALGIDKWVNPQHKSKLVAEKHTMFLGYSFPQLTYHDIHAILPKLLKWGPIASNSVELGPA